MTTVSNGHSELLEQGIGVRLDLDRREPVGNRPGRLQAVAGDAEDDAIVGGDGSLAECLTERAEADPGGSFAEDARVLGEQKHVLADLVLGHRVDRAT